MKQKEVLLIVVLAIVSGIFSFLISGFLIATPSNLKTQVEVVDPITSEFDDPDKRYFNAESINPTHLIRIEESQNQNPFN